MAVIVLIAGSLLGFLAGLFAFFTGSGFMSAILLWFSVAILSSILVGIFALLPRRNLSPAEV